MDRELADLALPAEIRRAAATLWAEHRAMKRAAAALLTELQRRINRVLGRTEPEVTVDERLLAAFFRLDGRPADLDDVLRASRAGKP